MRVDVNRLRQQVAVVGLFADEASAVGQSGHQELHQAWTLLHKILDEITLGSECIIEPTIGTTRSGVQDEG